MITRLGAVFIFTPYFVIPAIAIALLGAWIGQVYIKAQLSVKRELSNAKAPVLGIFGAAINGLRTYLAGAYRPLIALTRIYSLHSCLWRAGGVSRGERGPYQSLFTRFTNLLQSQPVRKVLPSKGSLLMLGHRWISVRVDALAAMFQGGLAFYLVYGNATRNASVIGFVISMAGTCVDHRGTRTTDTSVSSLI